MRNITNVVLSKRVLFHWQIVPWNLMLKGSVRAKNTVWFEENSLCAFCRCCHIKMTLHYSLPSGKSKRQCNMTNISAAFTPCVAVLLLVTQRFSSVGLSGLHVTAFIFWPFWFFFSFHCFSSSPQLYSEMQHTAVCINKQIHYELPAQHQSDKLTRSWCVHSGVHSLIKRCWVLTNWDKLQLTVR